MPPSPVVRIYAIGEIFGHVDLFARLIANMRRDTVRRGPAPTQIVVLGGFVSYGPDTAGIVRLLRQLSEANDNVIVLKGCVEEVMLEAWQGDLDRLEAWLCLGGDKALMSWGVPSSVIDGPLEALMDAMHAAIDPDDVTWIAARPLCHRNGKYVFAHAGIRPDRSLAQQHEEDLVWLDATQVPAPRQFTLVHAHQVVANRPVLRRRRISVTTNPHRTGRLAAVALEGSRRWIIEAREAQ